MKSTLSVDLTLRSIEATTTEIGITTTSPDVSVGDLDVIDAARTATLPVSVDDAAGAREADRVPLRLPRD